jgi:membrane fusion protein (multidrug efflux system)
LVPVEVAEVTTGDIASFFTGTATLEAEEETEVVAKVSGVVERILAEEGQYVVAGQALARLDDEKLAIELDRASANLENLEQEFSRAEELFAGNLISAQEFQQAKYDYEHQKAVAELAKLDLEYSTIRAPISGVVAERLIKVGNMVLANSSVYRITGMNPLLAVLHVPEREIGKLRKGHRARLRADALEGTAFDGRIERISPVVDPATGTVKVTVEVTDRQGRLKPGMFARVDIIHDVHENATLVPKDAIIVEDRESSVFVVRDSTAIRQTVVTGYVNTSHIEVLSGLAAGDTVVTTGKGSLKDSTKVETVTPGAYARGKQEEEAGEAEAEGAQGEAAESGEEAEGSEETPAAADDETDDDQDTGDGSDAEDETSVAGT